MIHGFATFAGVVVDAGKVLIDRTGAALARRSTRRQLTNSESARSGIFLEKHLLQR
jgi:hypothetical protein